MRKLELGKAECLYLRELLKLSLFYLGSRDSDFQLNGQRLLNKVNKYIEKGETDGSTSTNN